MTAATDALNSGLLRIASLRDGNLDGVSRLLLGQRRQEEESADHKHGDDDEHDKPRHGPGFCRARKPLYSPF